MPEQFGRGFDYLVSLAAQHRRLIMQQVRKEIATKQAENGSVGPEKLGV
jgi:hypothetical protein